MAPSFLSHLKSTHCSRHCFYSSSQNCHFILPQTPCLAPTQHWWSYATLINPSFHFYHSFLSYSNSPHSLNFFPSNSRSFCYHCSTFTNSVQPASQITKALRKVNLVKRWYFFSWFHNFFLVSTHSLQAKPSARVEVTLFIFAHLPSTHLPHWVHITEFSITLLLHLAHRSTLLLSTSPFEPLTITLIFLRFYFSTVCYFNFFFFTMQHCSGLLIRMYLRNMQLSIFWAVYLFNS